MSQTTSNLPAETIERHPRRPARQPRSDDAATGPGPGRAGGGGDPALPDGRSVELDMTRWEQLFGSFPELGKVHVIVSNASVTCEVVGEFGGYSTWGEFFNVQTKTLDMHIRHAHLAAAFAVEKPSHMDGVNTLSFQFFDQDGASALKVFVVFGGQKPPLERIAQFQRIRDQFRKDRE